MANTYQTLDFQFLGSVTQLPRQSTFSTAPYLESTSGGSSPDSPQNMSQLMFNGDPMQYDMFNYGARPAYFYPTGQQNKIPVEYTGSSTLDHRDRRRRSSGSRSTSSKDRDNLTNKHQRRRAQNRASQRAFGERKEKHVKGLEHQLEDLHKKHQDLLQCYNRQSSEVSRLNSSIGELTTELNSMRNSLNQSYSEMLMPDKFDKFDAFSSHI